MPFRPIRVLLADDQALVREGLKALLDLERDLTVTAVADGAEALAAAARQRPHVVLLDVRMPVMDGVTCVRHLKKRYPRLPVLMLTTYDDDHLVRQSLDAGASAYLLKDMEAEELAAAIRLLAVGDTLIPGDLARNLLAQASGADPSADQPGDGLPAPARPKTNDPSIEPLTPRQKEILTLIASGLSNKEIAARLHLSEGTVKNTVSEIYGRLQVRDRVQAVLKARGLGLG